MFTMAFLVPRAGFPATHLLVPISNSFMARNYCPTGAREGRVQRETGLDPGPGGQWQCAQKAGPWRKQRPRTPLAPWQPEGVTCWKKWGLTQIKGEAGTSPARSILKYETKAQPLEFLPAASQVPQQLGTRLWPSLHHTSRKASPGWGSAILLSIRVINKEFRAWPSYLRWWQEAQRETIQESLYGQHSLTDIFV